LDATARQRSEGIKIMRKTTALQGAALALVLAAASGPALAKDQVIHAGRLIDGVGKTPREKVSILIHDDRITGVQAGFVTPAGAEVVDLSTATVLPGLIDAHDHITSVFDGGNPVVEAVTGSGYDGAYASVGAAWATLEAGFTTIRDVGADNATIRAGPTTLSTAPRPAAASCAASAARAWT
jgi:imidazolonepropionase-like amidohydrolase